MKTSIEEFLKYFDQTHLLIDLGEEQKKRLEKQLSALSLKSKEAKKLPPFSGKQEEYCPFSLPLFSTKEDGEIGANAIAEGSVGSVLLAGGQGSRLGFDAPKGCFPITLVKQKSLFQLYCEKVLAAEKKYGKRLQIAILTSQMNLATIEKFFQDHEFFGLKREQIDFFAQDLLPYCTEEGKWILLDDGTIAVGPDGNGALFKKFYQSGLYRHFQKLGIEHIQISFIDNPLADPLDERFIGLHIRKKSQFSLKAIDKDPTDQHMGVLAEIKKKIVILESCEISPQKTHVFRYANTGIFCISMSFMEMMAKKELPIHWVRKKYNMENERELWKPEYFIVDALGFASSVSVVHAEREDCFAPIKNSFGKDSPSTAREFLFQRETRIYAEIFQEKPPIELFELAPQFYYPTEALKDRARQNKIFFTKEGYLSIPDL